MTSQTHGIQPSWMDPNADPATDFNRFANGGWIDSAVIPDEYPKWGTFYVLRDQALDTQKLLLSRLASEAAEPGSNAQKVRDFYATGMDEATVEAQGAKPLAAEFARIQRIRNLRDFGRVLAHLHNIGVSSVFGFGASPDFTNSSQVIAHILQGGLGLPDRDYYLKDDEESAGIRQKYVAHVTRMFQLLGEKPAIARRHANAVMEIETALATIMMSKVDRRDPDNINNKMALSQFESLFGGFPVARYFKALGAPSFDEINVHQPEYFKGVNALLSSIPMRQWKAYLRWHLLTSTSDSLSSAFVQENFEFYGKTLQGSQALQPRWKRMIESTNGALGEAIGQLYVAEKFPPESKAKVISIIEAVRAELRLALTNASWMEEQTRQAALVKLDALKLMIGYPDKWQDYSDLHIDRQSFVGNVLRANEFHARLDLEKIGKPLDRTEWHMTPQTVNAYYSPSMNVMVYPAAILQPPFFDPQADDAANFGGIGVVGGHEMRHGFDDKGCKYDADGNLKNWWTDADKANYAARMLLIIEQFDGFTVADGAKVNGKLVVGEASSDLGGVQLSHSALVKKLNGSETVIHGFNDKQRFFIAFAQLWASRSRPEAEKFQVANDPHPPAQFRVNGTLANVPEFAEAFNLPEHASIMLPAHKRCQLW